MAKHKKSAHWQSVFQAQRESGLSIVHFCQQNHINISTYYAWRKRLGESKQTPKQKSHQLVPLFVNEPTATKTSSLILTTPKGYQLTFDEAMPVHKLQQVLGLLEWLAQRKCTSSLALLTCESRSMVYPLSCVTSLSATQWVKPGLFFVINSAIN